ncbi:MAG: TatD family hydrolase [Bifidobacteriaceae bacterium]|jgi:TatD DNase family protein|nr:TatD family hydrolase [Bifidobacteriaceae bacterium]
MARDRSYPPAPEPLPFSVVDNHAHIEPSQRFPEEPLDLAAHVEAAGQAGVDGIVQCGCDLEAARWTATEAVLNSAVLGAIAIHPNDAARLATRPGAYEAAFQEIADLARRTERVRAVGETGLDYFRTGPEGRGAQLEAFRDHIALAKELGKALQIHDRDAHYDVIATLLREGAPERTVFHCFSGDREMARIAAENGWYCSFAGTMTFKPAEELRAAAAELPNDLLLVETDSPYLTPDPFRGRPNAPYMVAVTTRALAKQMDLPLEAACQQIRANSERVYGKW